MAVSTFLSSAAVKKSKRSAPLDFQNVYDQLLQVLPTALNLQRRVELVKSCTPDFF